MFLEAIEASKPMEIMEAGKLRITVSVNHLLMEVINIRRPPRLIA
jgi:hypothetical protein